MYESDTANSVDDLLSRASGVRNRFRQLALQPSLRSSHEARSLLEEYADIGYELEPYQLFLDPIY